MFFTSSEAIYRWCFDCAVSTMWSREGASLEVQQGKPNPRSDVSMVMA